jgi:hypothetical protein
MVFFQHCQITPDGHWGYPEVTDEIIGGNGVLSLDHLNNLFAALIRQQLAMVLMNVIHRAILLGGGFNPVIILQPADSARCLTSDKK